MDVPFPTPADPQAQTFNNQSANLPDNSQRDQNPPSEDEERKITTPVFQEAFNIARTDTVNFVNRVVQEAVNLSASDIFFEPRDNLVDIRLRVDGAMYEVGSINLDVHDQVASRIKVMSNLDPTEKRKIQEGQFAIKDYQGATVNLRVEIAQTVNGELVVIRIHKRETIIMDISQLGLSESAFKKFGNLLNERSGLVIACGPTGSGKTTTLYSMLTKLNERQEYNVMTIEDPVEYKLDGTNQMQVQEEIEFTFAQGLRTILRLSPDIVLVGEIRDKETAAVAVESGLTGQLVLSTLHSDDSVGAIVRLMDLGIEGYLLNSVLRGVVAQRLVRRVCNVCKSPYQVSQEELEFFLKVMGREPKQSVKSNGCEQCKNLGFKGRAGVFEVLPIDAYVRSLVRSKASEVELREAIMKQGFVTLLQDGLKKAEAGITTISEVLRNSVRVN